jgi:tetratricopeptide (TPR) repeat protein
MDQPDRMNAQNPAELRRWSEEVARDPGASSFLPLANAYRRQGRREAALRVCLRGLERQPTHVEAHALLAKLYLETGDRERAADEWATVLRLDTRNFDALRGLGFTYLERGDLPAAERHLRDARELRPADRTIAAAFDVLEERRTHASLARVPAGPRRPADPTHLFEELAEQAPYRGALVLDARGLTVAGRLVDQTAGRSELLGAGIGSVIEEAGRTAMHLGLGQWRGLLIETGEVAVHVSMVDAAHTVALIAGADAPAGWVIRTARRALEIADAFVRQGAA